MTLAPETAPAHPADGVDVLELYRAHLGSGRSMLGSVMGGITEVESSGAYVTGADGRRFLDVGGYGVFILGHRHPRVVAAVHAQLDRHPLATRVFLEPMTALAAHALAGIAPPGLDQVHFVNSGAEATETALKLARVHGHDRLVSAVSGYHGKTLGALSATANPMYQRPFEPLAEARTHIPYGDIGAMRETLARLGSRACVILEPVQGEGGVVVPPPGYLGQVSAACKEAGALLVIDEVQTGLGRLGSWWGIDAQDVEPDLLLVGKGLSGGVVPVAAVLATRAAYQPFGDDPFLHTSTFGGSPLASAAALAAITVMRDEHIVTRSATLGDELLAELTRVAAGFPGMVEQVRGRGLLLGLKMADPGLVGELVLSLVDRDVLANHSLNAASVLRLTPPAILGPDELRQCVTAVAESLAEVKAKS
jgi:putrescine aminotransferase